MRTAIHHDDRRTRAGGVPRPALAAGVAGDHGLLSDTRRIIWVPPNLWKG
jgi:hypothetical protein